MMNPHTSEPFGPVILSLAIIVGSPALASLVPTELVTTLTATPLQQAAIVILGGALLAAFSFWAIPRVSVRGSTAAEGGDD